MKLPQDKSTKQRIIMVFTALLESPFYYTVQDFASLHNISRDTIREDFEAIKNAGFNVLYDKKFRYALQTNSSIRHLEDFLFINETEKELIKSALAASSIAKGKIEKVLSKIESILDYSKIGRQTINKAYIHKIQCLEKAISDKQKVILKNYKSTNSRNVSDRTVEAYHINPKDDCIHAYDLEKQENRIFKISRFESLTQLNDDWENEGKHYLLHPDIFGIVNRNQFRTAIKFNLAAYNSLIDHYPMAKAYINNDPVYPGILILECDVNAGFLGLSNFIFENAEHINEILEPSELIDHLNEKIKKINF